MYSLFLPWMTCCSGTVLEVEALLSLLLLSDLCSSCFSCIGSAGCCISSMRGSASFNVIVGSSSVCADEDDDDEELEDCWDDEL